MWLNRIWCIFLPKPDASLFSGTSSEAAGKCSLSPDSQMTAEPNSSSLTTAEQVGGRHAGQMAAGLQAADLLLHGAQPKPPAKLVGQIDHEGVYPLRFARIWHSSDDSQLPRHHLHLSISITTCIHCCVDHQRVQETPIIGSNRHPGQGPRDTHHRVQETPFIATKRHPS